MNGDQVRVDAISATTGQRGLVVQLVLRNDADRTMYAYARPRRIQYDAASQTLRLVLHDRNPEPLIDRHLKRPPIVELTAGTSTEMTVTAPAVLRRLRSREETGGGPAQVEIIRTDQARTVDVEIGYADTPFYPREGDVPMGAQLREWTTSVLSTSAPVTPAPSRGPGQ